MRNVVSLCLKAESIGEGSRTCTPSYDIELVAAEEVESLHYHVRSFSRTEGLTLEALHEAAATRASLESWPGVEFFAGFGAALVTHFFPMDEARVHLQEALKKACVGPNGACLEIYSDCSQLLGLPWELLYMRPAYCAKSSFVFLEPGLWIDRRMPGYKKRSIPWTDSLLRNVGLSCRSGKGNERDQVLDQKHEQTMLCDILLGFKEHRGRLPNDGLLDACERRFLQCIAVYEKPVPIVALRAQATLVYEGYVPELESLLSKLASMALLNHIYNEDTQESLWRVHRLTASWLSTQFEDEELALVDDVSCILWRKALLVAAEYFQERAIESQEDRITLHLQAYCYAMRAKEPVKAGWMALKAVDEMKRRGFWQKAMSWCHELEQDAPSTEAEKSLQGAVYRRQGHLLLHWGRWSEALSAYQASLEIAEEIRDRPGISKCLMNMGGVYRSQSRWSEALSSYQASLKIVEALENKAGISACLNNMGVVYESQGRWSEALSSYEASLKIAKELKSKSGISACLTNIGVVYEIQGHWSKALVNYEASLGIFEALGDKAGISACLMNIGVVYESQRRWPEALSNYEASLEIFEELGDKAGVSSCLTNMGNVQRSRGHWSEALSNYELSLKIDEELGNKAGVSACLTNIGLVYESLGHWSEALSKYEASLLIREELGDKLGISKCLTNMSVVYGLQDRGLEALSCATLAFRSYRVLGAHQFHFSQGRLRKIREEMGRSAFVDACAILPQTWAVMSSYVVLGAWLEEQESAKDMAAMDFLTMLNEG